MGTSKPRPDVDKYAKAAAVCACNNVRKASRAITQLFDQALAPSALRFTQFVILLETAGVDSLTLSQLARRLVMDRSTLLRGLRILARASLIKVGSVKGTRSPLLTLTPQGQKVLERAVVVWERAQSRFVKQLGEKRWRILRENLSAAVTAAREA